MKICQKHSDTPDVIFAAWRTPCNGARLVIVKARNAAHKAPQQSKYGPTFDLAPKHWNAQNTQSVAATYWHQ
jgi:hypothetical protein